MVSVILIAFGEGLADLTLWCKMNMYRFCIFFVLISFMVCCKQTGRDQDGVKCLVHVDFPLERSIHFVDSIVLPDVFRLDNWKVVDGVVVTMNNEPNDFIKTYEYPSFRKLYDYGTSGRGPGEWIVDNWGETLGSDDIVLYDIMRRVLFKFHVDATGLNPVDTCSLSLPGELCPPYTQIHQLDDSLFLLKEDDNETNLRLLKLRSGVVCSSYRCVLRDEVDSPYTPFDYYYSISNRNILIAYCYMNRLEFVGIDSSFKLKPSLVIGDDKDYSKMLDYDELPNFYLDVQSYSNNFYCLFSRNRLENGDEIHVYSGEGNPQKKLRLDRCVSRITFAHDSLMLAYRAGEDKNIIYRYNVNH